MPIIDIDMIFQEPITKESINKMILQQPRRVKLSKEWTTPLHEPRSEGEDWSLVLPFCETLENAFHSMCRVKSSIGLRSGSGNPPRCYTFIKDASEIAEVEGWLTTVRDYIAIRDCLALSFALDYDRQNGDPDKPPTPIGDLRRRAKPYSNSPTPDTYTAADELAKECIKFLRKVNCYDSADVVVAMPPSSPDKPFDLPAYLADEISKKIGKKNFSSYIVTVKARPPIKESELKKKLEALEGTIEIGSTSFKGKAILLIDDIYQSGISINYVAMLLLQAGAKKVFGLACEKTCSNDDNISRKK